MKDQGFAADPQHSPLSVGIIGGGIAGSTIALRLAELGIEVELFEEGSSLVNGPPICHLHAGGNLYREISDEQCLTLLKQSIETLKVFPHTTNIRPTVVAIPQHDAGQPDALLPRLTQLQAAYRQLVNEDVGNRVLGNPEHYFKLYDRTAMEQLRCQPNPVTPTRLDDWMIPVAKHLELDKFKYPMVLVQEYGWSVFRLAATANLALDRLPSCQVHTRSRVVKVNQETNLRWSIEFEQYDSVSQQSQRLSTQVDYLVNACGFQTGVIDDLAKLKRQRLVEFKAAYVTRWLECEGVWPEVIFHGERGTPDGMAQLTPYPDGFFQLHGMTEDITLFREGLVASTPDSAQPKLAERFIRKLTTGWQTEDIHLRSQRAISHIARFVPAYESATIGGKPLFGAQQIPGDDATLRAADISFDGHRYARTEIVKASSALSAADSILEKLQRDGLITLKSGSESQKNAFPVTSSLSHHEVESKAIELAIEREYPEALAKTLSYPLA